MFSNFLSFLNGKTRQKGIFKSLRVSKVLLACVIIYAFSHLFSVPILNSKILASNNSLRLDVFIQIVNTLGNSSKLIQMDRVESVIHRSSISPEAKKSYKNTVTAIYDKIQRKKLNSTKSSILSLHTQGPTNKNIRKTTIYLAAIACGEIVDEAITMLKSAAIFSQDAKLHIIIFYDDDSKNKLALNLLELKMTTEAMHWEFTFEMHKGSYPNGSEKMWKNFYIKCTTQRLFFPSALPHIDAAIYLDTDNIVLSNLTELWSEFGRKLQGKKMFAAVQHSEPEVFNHYPARPVPYLPPMGINAGVILMNLTQLREFKLEERSIAVYTAYKEWVIWSDQDILNMVLGPFANRTATLECSYNFYRFNCDFMEYLPTSIKNPGFCKTVGKRGIKILHGCAGGLESKEREILFYSQAYNAFKKLDLLTDSYMKMFVKLRKDFDALPHRPCTPLTADIIYRNGERYLNSLNLS